MRGLVILVACGGIACGGADDGRFRAPDHATWGDSRADQQPADAEALRRATFQGPDGAYEVFYDEAGRAVVPQRPLPEDPPPVRSRPARVGPKTITLRRAPLDGALRLIAEAGDFNLLLEGPLDEPVSLDLRNVEPYDALVTLAQTHGASVRYDGQIVVVIAR